MVFFIPSSISFFSVITNEYQSTFCSQSCLYLFPNFPPAEKTWLDCCIKSPFFCNAVRQVQLSCLAIVSKKEFSEPFWRPLPVKTGENVSCNLIFPKGFFVNTGTLFYVFGFPIGNDNVLTQSIAEYLKYHCRVWTPDKNQPSNLTEEIILYQ